MTWQSPTLCCSSTTRSRPPGWVKVYKDLLKGAGGPDVYLAYNPAGSDAITSIILIGADIPLPETYTQVPPVLNSGLKLSLCYSRDAGMGAEIISLDALQLDEAPTDNQPPPWIRVSCQDVNQGQGDWYVYVCYANVPAPPIS
jgi:hypothetical protein